MKADKVLELKNAGFFWDNLSAEVREQMFLGNIFKCEKHVIFWLDIEVLTIIDGSENPIVLILCETENLIQNATGWHVRKRTELRNTQATTLHSHWNTWKDCMVSDGGLIYTNRKKLIPERVLEANVDAESPLEQRQKPQGKEGYYAPN